MIVTYPTLEGEIAKRGIKKCAIASRVGISARSLSNKLSGRMSFTLDEAFQIQKQFFPNIDINDLFKRRTETEGICTTT